ncbi:unnamed protein product [Polarella glacialis]|uniref:Uncharacterized protein n=1 Tax=Polarella glacialis TaxID=89957 RepID=A0A813D6U3_POLGL|nr:unnamed protein product [Polarella glacialis]
MDADGAHVTPSRRCFRIADLRAVAFAIVPAEWQRSMVGSKKLKQFEESVKAAEEQLKAHMKLKSEEALHVLDRMTGSSNTGLLCQTFGLWAEEWREVKQEKEMQEALSGENSRLKSLKSRHKSAGFAVASRMASNLESTFLMEVFLSWSFEAQTSAVQTYYDSNLSKKDQKFEAVQSMINSFATQLEQGLGGSPRSKSGSTKTSSRPPLAA